MTELCEKLCELVINDIFMMLSHLVTNNPNRSGGGTQMEMESLWEGSEGEFPGDAADSVVVPSSGRNV